VTDGWQTDRQTDMCRNKRNRWRFRLKSWQMRDESSISCVYLALSWFYLSVCVAAELIKTIRHDEIFADRTLRVMTLSWLAGQTPSIRQYTSTPGCICKPLLDIISRLQMSPRLTQPDATSWLFPVDSLRRSRAVEEGGHWQDDQSSDIFSSGKQFRVIKFLYNAFSWDLVSSCSTGDWRHRRGQKALKCGLPSNVPKLKLKINQHLRDIWRQK